MLNRVVKILFFFTQIRDDKRMHYIRAKVNGDKGCVQGVISDSMALQLKATPGTCADIGCQIYKGKTTIPLCCKVTGYSCNEYI